MADKIVETIQKALLRLDENGLLLTADLCIQEVIKRRNQKRVVDNGTGN